MPKDESLDNKNKIFKKWIEFAKADFDVAQRLFNSPKPTRWTYLLALWHCHQCLEKTLKMIIIKKDKELLQIHDLVRLYELAEINLTKEQMHLLEDLNEYYLKSRYPDVLYKPLPEPSKIITQDYLKQTRRLFLCLKKK